MFPDGGVMQMSQTNVPVQFDDINTMFDAKTRPAVEQDLVGFGNTLAGRGSSLNDTIASLPALFGHLKPVAQYLSDPNTQLTRFFVALNGFFSTLSPVAQVNANLFADQATTFEAISRDPNALANTIKESPSDARRLDRVAEGAAAVPGRPDHVQPEAAARDRAARAGASERQPGARRRDPGAASHPEHEPEARGRAHVAEVARLDPGTNIALNGLTATVGTLNPMIRYLGPYVTVCNQFNYFWEEIQDLVSEQTNFGMAQRALMQFNNHQATNTGAQGGTYPANGYQPGDPPDQGYPGDAEYAHGPAYAGAVDSNGNADCEVGQRGYPAMPNGLDPQHRSIVSDAHTPGAQGTTWAGLSQVRRARRSAATRSSGRSSPTSRGTTDEAPGGMYQRKFSPLLAGAIGIVLIIPFIVRRVHEVRQPVREPVHGPRDVLERQRAQAGLTGPDRGDQRRQGHERARRLKGSRLGRPTAGSARPPT